ncbi:MULTISPECIES: hypothetical protein [Virgibacillus]|uniref:Uncharacterized protein n=2 Tax=Virgibacillus TaxID=84406 RepID=A0A024QII2_9BACI|nr:MULTISPECIES: hypothetical protein [Virgibacillus]EQB36940.1 hypothetical protein M948_10965 [Virgibacillus sp. CM-4]GGJ64938.1 hypothetical protein GCM10007111_28510 [Virgibacillus kapii]CDQ41970.1 hypothetical protein BN990_04349 [Virgibacillus massiliensis]
MVKSIKGQFILSMFVAIAFIYNTSNFTDFIKEDAFHLPYVMFYVAMIASVFNAGICTQKYVEFRKNAKGKN